MSAYLKAHREVILQGKPHLEGTFTFKVASRWSSSDIKVTLIPSAVAAPPGKEGAKYATRLIHVENVPLMPATPTGSASCVDHRRELFLDTFWIIVSAKYLSILLTHAENKC